MVSSQSVLNEINEQIRNYGEKKNKLSTDLETYQREQMTVSQQLTSTYTKLAQFYLPELDAKSVASTLQEKRNQMQSILEDKLERINYLKEQSKNNRSLHKTAALDITRTQDAALATDVAIEEAKTRAAEALKADANYTSLITTTKEFEKRMDLDKVVYQAILDEVPKRIDEYNKDKLFSYLLRCGFDTPEYKKTGLTLKGDKFVAYVIDFSDNNRKYKHLIGLPEEIQKLFDKDKTILKEYHEGISKIEKEVEGKVGLTKAIADDKAAEKAHTKAVQLVHALDDAHSDMQKELTSLESKQNEFYSKALTDLTSFLKSDSFLQLRERARRTPSPEDDGLVRKIEEFDEVQQDLQDKIKRRNNELEVVEEKLKGLSTIKRDFHSSNYNSSRSYFSDGFDMSDLLLAYIAGRMSASDVCHKVDVGHRKRPETTYTYTPSSSSSDNPFKFPSSSSSSRTTSTGGFGSSSSRHSTGGFSGGGGGRRSTGGF